MQTFPSKKIISIKNCFAAVETENKSVEKFLFSVCKNLELNPFKINSDDKTFYHLAGVYASNFLVGNIFSAESLFKNKLKNDLKFFKIAEPIINSTLSNIKKNKVEDSLSGPIDRGDYKTILKHISSLKKRKDFIYEDVNLQLYNYVLQSLILLKTTEKKYEKLSDDHLKIKMILFDEIKSLQN